MKKSKQSKPLIVYILAILGAGILFMLAFQNYDIMRPFMNKKTTGQITQSTHVTFSGRGAQEMPHFSVAYTYQVDGHEYTGHSQIDELKTNSVNSEDLRGASINVNYLQNDPAIHYVDGNYSPWITSYVKLFIAFFILIGVGIHAFKYKFFNGYLSVAGLLVILWMASWLSFRIYKLLN